MLYELGGKRELAVARYEDAIRLDPNLGEAKNNLAYLFADSGQNLDRALDLAQEAKTQLPDNASVADTLGWVLLQARHSLGGDQLPEGGRGGHRPERRQHRHRPPPPGAGLRGERRYRRRRARRSRASLAGLEKQLAAARAKGATAAEPPWAADVRAMLERLKAKA